ncbi:MAG TPA: glycosyltransferase, partial [Anaerolineae bacterium]
DFPLERCGPPLSDEELIKMYSRSRISLGFSSVAEQPVPGQPPIKQVRLRDFEAPMSGAFYMVEAYDELQEFFEPDKEIVFFTSAEELIDKTRYYLAHDAERERIRQAGMQRARIEHSWHERFRMVFREIGLG